MHATESDLSPRTSRRGSAAIMTKMSDDARRAAVMRNLNRLMLQKGWRQADLVRLTKIGRDSISRYCRGETLPDPLPLMKLAHALGVRPKEIDPGADLEDVPPVLPPETAKQAPVRSFDLIEDPEDPERMILRINRSLPADVALEMIALLRKGNKLS